VAYTELLTSVPERGLELARGVIPVAARQAGKKLLRDPKRVLRDAAQRLGMFNDAKLLRQGALGLRLRERLQAVYRLPENGAADLERKVRAIHELDSGPAFRCNVWRELARLERLRGNELVASAYDIRLMRLLGDDRFGQLAALGASLRKNGFERVALACEAQYESAPGAAARVYEFLHEASRRCRQSAAGAWERQEDRRSGAPRVAVIVSLYNAAPKLRLFLTALAQQTLVRERQVEIILVDSASPADEYAVAKEFLAAGLLSAVYARSAQRETIQAAWNRGIHLARAPYLVFLGADETLYPEALQVLADELDRHPQTDWVMANSLVTDVDERGVFRKDVFPYDRSGGSKDHSYLETCYLSWVGGMYRKTVHERFGYYDESFRAAGDTEFKNRVLPHIGVRFVPKTLGLFLNYPDARTTASPAAEIEDARAWYIHRSAGGVKFAFERRDPADALQLFYASLGYRKSYAKHTSSDIEYGRCLLRHALAAGAAPDLAPLDAGLGELLESLRRFEWAGGDRPLPSPLRLLAQTWRDAAARQRAHARLLKGKASPAYRVLNDNRFEQHFWLWNTF
jgi:glycosyltransferase involved in cell wall biosynthesis